jgi:hypothetical protein
VISASINNVAAPFDTNELYWIALGACRPARYSPASFFFASSDGSRLVPAMNDQARFISALAEAIGSFSSFEFVVGLQELLNDLTAPNVPAPRYPQVGDIGVSGAVIFAVRLTTYFPGVGVPPPWINLPPIWVGAIQADIAANNYSTPPANADIQFKFQFRSDTEVGAGDAVTFDIAQGKFAPYAVGVQ